eukprot:Gb_24538 [translate_table: standard]
MASWGSIKGAAGYNRNTSFTTHGKYSSLGRSLSFTLRLLPTTDSSSSCAFFITCGFFSSSDIAHPNVVDDVSDPAAIMSRMIALMFSLVISIIRVSEISKSASTKSLLVSPFSFRRSICSSMTLSANASYVLNTFFMRRMSPCKSKQFIKGMKSPILKAPSTAAIS